MAISADVRAAAQAEDDEPRQRGVAMGWRRVAVVGAVVAAAAGLFFAYLRMAWAHPINADGASNALQAADLLRGNVLLRGWTLSDVSFYTTELVQYAFLQAIVGLGPDMIRIAAAMTYTLLVLLVAALAKGRATGLAAATRVGLAAAIMLVPAPGIGYQTLLSSPNHTGTGVPLVVTWLVLDRALSTRREPRWWLPVVIAALLAWGEIGDPLVTFVGALPLVLVSAVRLLRAGAGRSVSGGRAGQSSTAGEPWSKRWRGLDARLIAAGIGSVVLAHAFLYAVRAAGGFHAPSPPIELSPLSDLGHRASMTARMVSVIFGAYLPDEHPTPLAVGLSLLHLAGLVLVACALVVVVVRAVRRRAEADASSQRASRVDEILVIAILVNIGAEVVSTLSVDIVAAREIAAVLPLGAALAGRVWGPRLHVRRLAPALAAVLVLLFGALVGYAPPRSVPAENQDVAEWLDSRHLRYGLASYWSASNITVTTRGRVTVVPVAGGDRVAPYCWQSRIDWYDRSKHDARFVIFDRERKMYGTEETATAQFGAPAEVRDFGRHVVLVYDHNLLDKMPAPCA
jgi:hypothetical protein